MCTKLVLPRLGDYSDSSDIFNNSGCKKISNSCLDVGRTWVIFYNGCCLWPELGDGAEGPGLSHAGWQRDL